MRARPQPADAASAGRCALVAALVAAAPLLLASPAFAAEGACDAARAFCRSGAFARALTPRTAVAAASGTDFQSAFVGVRLHRCALRASRGKC